MKMISISKFGLRASFAALLLAATSTVSASASVSSFCMNTSNGNGGSTNYYPYQFNNNTFGWSSDKSGSSECYSLDYVNSASGGVYYDGFSATYNWPFTSASQYNVKAYPSMVYGWQYGYAYSGLGLPSIIYNNKSVPTSQTYTVSGTQNEDVLIDNWLLTSPNASAQADEVEIFVSNDINAYQSGNLGTFKATNNVTYNVSSRTGGAWNVYNFIPSNTSKSGSVSVNIRDFVNALCYDEMVIQNNLYLGGTQIGLEVYTTNGSASVKFNPAAISVQ